MGAAAAMSTNTDNVTALAWLTATCGLLGLVAWALCGCSNTSRWQDYERGIRAGQYETIRTCIWYDGRWVPIIEPKRVEQPKKGPRT